MGWLTTKIDRWAGNRERAEMEEFLSLLKRMDGAELGRAVAVATHFRHCLEEDGHNPLDPIAYAATNPGFPLFLSTTANRLKKQKRPEATAFIIWTHTARAGARLELRDVGRDMWRELSRGFPHVKSAAQRYKALTGIDLNITDAKRFPSGLTPEPQ